MDQLVVGPQPIPCQQSSTESHTVPVLAISLMALGLSSLFSSGKARPPHPSTCSLSIILCAWEMHGIWLAQIWLLLMSSAVCLAVAQVPAAIGSDSTCCKRVHIE